MSKNKICVACGSEDFEDNINNFCCNCGKDIDTGLTLEEMDKQGINYIIDRRTNEYKNDITKNNDINCLNCQQKDARIAELEKENNEFCSYNKKIREEISKLKAEIEKQLADKKETATYKNNFCINCCKDKSGEQIICLKCHEEVCNAFKKQLAEKDRLLENTVIPKFKIGDEVWIIKRIKQEVANGKVIKKYLYFNGGTPENLRNVNRWRIRLRNNSEVTKKEYELFYTRKEAEEALKKLEEK